MSSFISTKIAVSPARLSPPPPTNKRKISPSAEASSSSKRTLMVTTPNKAPSDISQGTQLTTHSFFAPRQLFPYSIANVTHEYTHGHPSPREQDEDKASWHARHVLLPFNLRDQNIDIFKGDVRSLLYDLFPGTTNVTEARCRSHLLFQVEELPSGPWPLTVGNVPFTILAETSQGRSLMFPRQNLGNLSISICGQYTINGFSDRVLRKLAASVEAEFRNKLPDVYIIEIMFTCERSFYVVLHDTININAIRIRLPGRIANCPVGYIHDHDLHRPVWMDQPTARQIEPQPRKGIFDNTVYDVLRPGVMICSKMLAEHGHSVVFSTTLGILVKNSAGHHFMTAASHGIGENAQVWQATRRDKIIGKAAVEIPFTDISLLELDDDIEFENETFENSGGAIPKFTRLVTSEDSFNWPLCHLNSPFTGNMEGNVVMKSVKLEAASTHPAEDRLRYVVYNWAYMGQEEGNEDKARPPNGTCGSAIWDDDGVVLGFYHYYIQEGQWSGFSPFVSASEVVEAGYDLVGSDEAE